MQLLKRGRSLLCNQGSRALAIFLAVMAVMTMISRAVDSLMIPQVSVCEFEEMKLEYPLEIEGRVGTVGKCAIYCQDNLRIENVWVQKNDVVEKGDLLFSLDMEELKEKIRQMEQEVRKYDLQMEDIENAYQQQVNQQDVSSVGEESGKSNTVMVTADQGDMDKSEGGNTRPGKDNAAALLQLDKQETEALLDSLYTLQKKKGKVCAEFAGRVFECTISTGSITSPEPVMILEDFSQPLQFEGTVGKDGEPCAKEGTDGESERTYKEESIVGVKKNLNIEEGVECTLEMEEDGTILEGVAISKITEGEEGTYRVIAEIEDMSLHQTGGSVLSFTKESRKYRSCVPLSALYSGKTGYYVIVVEEDKTILGIQSVARFVSVTVIENNDEYAAVEGNLSENDKIVVQANKEVKEGERVRIIEE